MSTGKMDPTYQLTAGQSNALMITERIVSVFSIFGIIFILVTFYFLSSFNKPINRLVFYASFGNLGMNIACLISKNGIKAGALSPLCQFQAFLIQMCGPPTALQVLHLLTSGTAGSWVSMHSGPAAWHGTSTLLSFINIPTATCVPSTSGISWAATVHLPYLLWPCCSFRVRNVGKSMAQPW